MALQPAITEDELNQRLQLELSKNMWKRCNPGFNHMAVSTLSKTQEEFLYDEDNVRRSPAMHAAHRRPRGRRRASVRAGPGRRRGRAGPTPDLTRRHPSLVGSVQIDPVDKTHCRRRDKFTSYVESSARYKLLMKKSRDSGA